MLDKTIFVPSIICLNVKALLEVLILSYALQRRLNSQNSLVVGL